MKVVLIENVKKIGKIGEVINVSDGYARNFLFPKNLADVATPEALKKAEKMKADKITNEKEETNKFSEMARELKDKKITILAKSKDGRLFGSINEKDIAKEVKAQLNLEIAENLINLKSPIKEIGETKVEIEFLKNIKATLSIEIKEEK